MCVLSFCPVLSSYSLLTHSSSHPSPPPSLPSHLQLQSGNEKQLCAWCYIGHIELEQGLALARARGLPVQFAVRYHPLFLNTSLNDVDTVPKSEYWVRKCQKEGPEGVQRALEMVLKRGREEGLEL